MTSNRRASTQRRSASSRRLHAVPDIENAAWVQLVADVLSQRDIEGDFVGCEQSTDWAQLSDVDAALVALGIPVAISGDELIPDRPDDNADVHEAVVLRIDAARLYRHLRQLPRLESKVLCLAWGVGCPALTQEQIGERVGMTREGVRWALRRGMSHLRESFGVNELEAA